VVQTDSVTAMYGHEGSRTGRANMDRDLQLLDEVRSGRVDLAFRTYTWDPWTVSLGKHQSDSVVDREALESAGLGLVHRPTGGRAVFHAEELTYCLVVRNPHPQIVYEIVHQLIQEALTEVVGPIFDEPTKTDRLREHYAAGTPLGQICFAASARTEITVGNRKVVGSAQRTLDGVVLQHGSILCGDAHLDLAELMNMDPDERASMKQILRSTSVSLQEVAGRTMTPVECASAIEAVFARTDLRMFNDHERREMS
jgi:lipoate-protein ligase A